MLSKKSLIAGHWEEGQSNTFTSYNPENGEQLADYKGVSLSQIDTAVVQAKKAFETFKTIDFERRANFIDDIASEIEALGDELLEVCNKETGLGIPRLTGERGRTCGQLRAFSALLREGSWQEARIDTAIPDRAPFPKPDIRSVLSPLGPIAVFSASNFPLAFSTLGGDTASALAGGNSVIVKGHPSHPGTSELCAKAIDKAIDKNNLPKGVFSLLQGAENSVSSHLVEHPLLEAIGFTGSTHVGRILFNLAASRPKPIPVFAEMGSTNPLFVLPNAIKNRGSEIAQGLAGSITLGTGQFCTKPGLIFIVKSDNSIVFKEALVEAINNIQIGNLLNAGIKSSLNQKLQEIKNEKGLTTLAGGDTQTGTVFLVNGCDFIQNSKLEEEIFGPVALVIECENMEELLEATKQLEGHLTGTIQTDNDEATKLKTILEERVGRILYNGFPTGVEVCPSMHHGGPYPSATSSVSTSVGTASIKRFCKVICYQNAPSEHLPEALQDKNPRGITRLINGIYSTKSL